MKLKNLFLTCAFATSFCFSAFSAEREISVIIKATDSEFFQHMASGAKKYAKENNDVKVNILGAPTEADIDKQVAILENVIQNKPDAIVIAAANSEALLPAIEKAADEGIVVITVDNKVDTPKVSSFLATDNLLGGSLAADKLVEAIKKNNLSMDGKVALISSMSGMIILDQRNDGFLNRMAEIAPNIEILPTRYTNNDILISMSTAQDMMTANKDLVGFFANNNHTGDGVALAIREAGAKGKVVAVAFDSDPEEVTALREGILYALIIQDPFGMGYKGTEAAIKVLNGEKLPAYVDTGVYAITQDVMDSEDMKLLLDPSLNP